MYSEFGISEKIIEISNQVEKELEPIFEKYEENCLKSSMKVLKAFQDNKVSTTDFNEVTGYGYYDGGREKLEKIYAQIFGAEDALVRPQIMSGTHALTIALFIISIIMLATMPKDMSTISGNEGMIQYFQKNPTVFLVAIVIPLFLLLFANIGILVWYVKRSTKPKETSLNELSEEEKEKLKQELMKDLLNKEEKKE